MAFEAKLRQSLQLGLGFWVLGLGFRVQVYRVGGLRFWASGVAGLRA